MIDIYAVVRVFAEIGANGTDSAAGIAPGVINAFAVAHDCKRVHFPTNIHNNTHATLHNTNVVRLRSQVVSTTIVAHPIFALH